MADTIHRTMIQGEVHPAMNHDTAANKPASPLLGDMFYEDDTYKMYLCIVAGSWIQISFVIHSASAPANPFNGLIWFDSTNGEWQGYNDGWRLLGG